MASEQTRHRPGHQQRIAAQYNDPTNLGEPFYSTQFIAFTGKSFKINNFGQMVLTFIVPPNFVDMALPLRGAMDVPLSVDVQLWKPYEDAMKLVP